MVEICLQGIYQCGSSKYLAAALLMQSLSTALWKGSLNEEQNMNKVGHGLKCTFQQCNFCNILSFILVTTVTKKKQTFLTYL